ncbi:MAG: type II toxin-antitoxin system RatA family toxin [Pseudomonadota bacterium]
MFQHQQRKQLPIPPRLLFELVLDVPSYPQFLPWCKGARINKRFNASFEADLIVGAKNYLNKTFTSLVEYDEQTGVITSRAIRGPFSHMSSRWIITSLVDCSEMADCEQWSKEGHSPVKQVLQTGSDIDFKVEFGFHSRLMENMLGSFFEVACLRMVEAFEKRAFKLFRYKLCQDNDMR